MGFLIALGTTFSYFFGCFSIVFSMIHNGNVPSYPDNLMTSAMLITFVLFGKVLEGTAKARTSDALKKLMEQKPKKAILLQVRHVDSGDTAVNSDGEIVVSYDDIDNIDAHLNQSNDSYTSSNNSERNYIVESEREVSTDLIEENDIVKVVRGMVIPADGEVIRGQGDAMEAMITGEPFPVHKKIGSSVIGGTQLLDGTLHIKVRTADGSSVLHQIIKLIEGAQMQKAPIQQLADNVAGKFALVVITCALLVFIIWEVILNYEMVSRTYFPEHVSNFYISFTFAVSTLVVACPCAMGLATPTAIMVGTGVGAKLGILIKSGAALETANKLTAVVFDKTGTLTMGTPAISRIHLINENSFKTIKTRTISNSSIEDSGRNVTETSSLTISQMNSSGKSEVLNDKLSESDMENSTDYMAERDIMWYAACVEMNSEHVIGRCIVRFYVANFVGAAPPVEPMHCTAVTGKGISGMVNGVEVHVGSLDYLREHDIKHANESTYLNLALFAQSEGAIVIFVAISGVLKAMIRLEDIPRPESRHTVEALRAKGLQLWIVTGDNGRTANAIGQSVGIPSQNIISSALPSTKIQHVKALQERGHVVGFVGDGINDAPALAQADVGIAIGGGTDVAIESADLVLMSSNIYNVYIAIDLSHAILRCIHRNMFWALAYNVIAIPIAAGALLNIIKRIIPPWVSGAAMAFSSVSVVLSSLSLLNYKPESSKLTKVLSDPGTSKNLQTVEEQYYNGGGDVETESQPLLDNREKSQAFLPHSSSKILSYAGPNDEIDRSTHSANSSNGNTKFNYGAIGNSVLKSTSKQNHVSPFGLAIYNGSDNDV
jgi:Cu+-exporting ATPase